MTDPRYPITARLPRGRVRHNARPIDGSPLVQTLCGKRDTPVDDGASLPHCAACAAKPVPPTDQRSYPKPETPPTTAPLGRIRLDDLTDNDLEQLYDRLDRIAAEHHRSTDADGRALNVCSACSRIWPCPTYRIASLDTPPNTMPTQPHKGNR
ncbi:hypothetical protein I5Q34_33635 [Streptomyces sp. AV19]|uniref:hypothetical protein n=1 Tax=Streptomyces sp. AV19 TaxID=2793068 RepID=UPI0018FEFE0B|nr:hypothetical protein [Streptomyces sp. AV19]MBH1939145.1 hypothetical protein [Streptomyces sp. AV19]MDG4535289.1 hypothetical protein [Streptomyces sp. AV19]